MQKIASPQDLQAEIRALMASVHASEKPDRQVIASKLRELADHVAGNKTAGRMKFRVWTGPTQVKEVTKRLQRAGIDADDGTEHTFGTMDADDKYDAMDKINEAAGYKLIKPRDLSNPNQVSFRSAAGKVPSKGQKDKAGEDTYKVLRVFPTKDDADGPLPKGLLRLIKKGGGAALVELLPPEGYKVKGDMLVSPDSSRPRYFIRAFGPSGSWDGFPVDLKPAQLKRLHSYREAAYREAIARAAARKPKVKLPKSIDPPSGTLKALQRAGLDTAVMSLSSPQSYMYKLNEKLRGNYGVSVPLPGSYRGEASVQIDPKGLTGDSGDAEVTLVAYAIANGTSTNIPLKKLKLYVWWEKRDKGYNIVLKVGTSKPNMDAEKKRLQDY